MAWVQWPYYPNSLSEIFAEEESNDGEKVNQVSFLLSGASEFIRRAFTVMELVFEADGSIKRDDNDQMVFQRIESFGERQEYENLCKYWRAEDGLGMDHACRCFDMKVARELWNKRRKDFVFKQCIPLRLGDTAGLIRVTGREVAVLLSGQFLPEEEGKSAEEKREEIAQIVREKAGTDVKEDRLKECLKALKTRNHYLQEIQELRKDEFGYIAKVEDVIRKAANNIERIAEAHYSQRKTQKESEFHNGLFPIGERNIITHEELKGRASGWIRNLKEFCGAEYVVLYAKDDPYISLPTTTGPLKSTAQAGFPENIVFPEFDWHAANLEFRDTHEPRINTEAVEVLKAGLGDDYTDLFSDARFLLPMEMGGTYLGLMVIGPMKGIRLEDTDRESDFLQMACHRILLRTLMDLQILDFEKKVDTLFTASRLTRHGFRAAFNPVSAAVRIIGRYLKEEVYTKENAQEAVEKLELVRKNMVIRLNVNTAMFVADHEGVYKFSTCSLREIVQRCVGEHTDYARGRGVNFTLPDVNWDLTLEADEDKLTLAISNVVHNAVKYSHPHCKPPKHVDIRAWPEIGHVILEIEDFGQGIDPVDIPHILEKGYQGRRSDLALGEPGEGLGLWQADLIIRAHGGGISARLPRSGSRDDRSHELEGYAVSFWITLPVKQQRHGG